jgi:hypothetical protein
MDAREKLIELAGKVMCAFGRHSLHSLKRLGVSEHIACERCFRQFGINHEIRVVIPWDADLADMYQRRHGYDNRANFHNWKAWIRTRSNG